MFKKRILIAILVLLLSVISCSNTDYDRPVPVPEKSSAKAIIVSLEELYDNPEKYEKGTMIQVEGQVDTRVPMPHSNDFYYLLKPPEEYHKSVAIFGGSMYSDWKYCHPGSHITVKGTFNGVYEIFPKDSSFYSLFPESPVLLDCELIEFEKPRYD
jgi:nitrous oxide reductase accessory protein NosL